MNKLNGKITKSATLRGAMTRGAGGGTYVEANPEGEATTALEKLMVEDTIYNVRNVPDASSAHNGDVLTKIASGVAWLPPTKELPTYTSGDNGKVLKIVNGSPTWDYPIKYSTDEQEIGTWIDGKKLYEKTFDRSSIELSDNSWSNNILGTNGTNINIKNFEGYFILQNAGKFSYSYFRSTSEYFTAVINANIDDLNVRPNMNAGLTIYAGIITIRYTKVGE